MTFDPSKPAMTRPDTAWSRMPPETNMTDTEKIVRCVEILGWSRSDKWVSGWVMPPDRDGMCVPSELPRLLIDANAALELIEWIAPQSWTPFWKPMNATKPMKYRKKPVVIEAFQFTKDLALRALIDNEPLPFGVTACGQYHPGNRTVSNAYIVIHTLEGNMRADLDDWIIKGVKGELYPCKPDIFSATYDPI